ncbi:MAG: universal stress protein [Acidimicrobiales bacterium]
MKGAKLVFDEVCVPHNGSPETTRALEVGAGLAGRSGADLRILAYANPDDHTIVSKRFYDGVFDIGRRNGLTPHVTALESRRFLSDAIVGELRVRPSSILCMASRGRDRSAVLLGSVTADVLTYGPGTAVLCGPKCEPDALEREGPVIVALDGEADTESVMAFVGRWVKPAGKEIELVESLPGDPVAAILSEIEATNASMIAMVSRVPIGVDRLLHGSVTDAVVRDSPVPVIAMRAHSPALLETSSEEDDELPFQVQILWM